MLEINKKTLRNIFLVVACCIVLYWILHESERVSTVLRVIKKVFSPFIMGAVIAFILNVPMRRFEQLLKGVKHDKFRRLLAVVLTFVAVLLVVALIFLLLIPQVVDTIQSLLPRMKVFFVNLEAFAKEMFNDNPRMLEWFSANIDFSNMDIATLTQKWLAPAASSLKDILGGAVSAVGTVAGVVIDFFIGLVFAVYCLFQKEVLARQSRKLIYALAPEKAADRIIRVMRLSNSTFSNFLSGQCVEVCILGCLFAVAMAIFKMPYIPLVSVLIAVTAFIPVVGAFVGCAIGAFLIFVNDPVQAIWFVLMFLILQAIENNLIYPRVVGDSIGLNGMWVLMAIAVGGAVMGVVGMFLMIPVASVLHTLLREFAAKRLAVRNVAAEKLTYQPPDLKSHYKEKRTMRKEKWALRKSKRVNKDEKNQKK